MKEKICIILGTRPEVIKMSPVIRACERLNSDYFILHTGQHYSYKMDGVFFEEMELPGVRYNLDVGSGRQGVQTGKMLTGIEKILMKEKPDVVLEGARMMMVMMGEGRDWENPFGDGMAGERIVGILMDEKI